MLQEEVIEKVYRYYKDHNEKYSESVTVQDIDMKKDVIMIKCSSTLNKIVCGEVVVLTNLSQILEKPQKFVGYVQLVEVLPKSK